MKEEEKDVKPKLDDRSSPIDCDHIRPDTDHAKIAPSSSSSKCDGCDGKQVWIVSCEQSAKEIRSSVKKWKEEAGRSRGKVENIRKNIREAPERMERSWAKKKKEHSEEYKRRVLKEHAEGRGRTIIAEENRQKALKGKIACLERALAQHSTQDIRAHSATDKNGPTKYLLPKTGKYYTFDSSRKHLVPV